MSQLDRTGLILSGVCLVHCAALPLAALLLPSVGSVLFDHSTALHWVMLGMAIPVSGYALWRGFSTHRRWLALGIGAVGLVLMALGVGHTLAVSMEIPLTISGALIVAASHVLNIRLMNASSGH